MRNFFVLCLTIFLNLNCLTAIYRRQFLEEKTPEPILSADCKFFATGTFPPKPYLIETFPVSTVLTAMTLDLATIVYLTSLNPWYGFGYFAFTYPFAAYESFPRDLQTYGSWCGKPKAPNDAPGDHFYAFRYWSAAGKCLLSDEDKTQIIYDALRVGKMKSVLDATTLIKTKEIKFLIFEDAKSTNTCYFALQVIDGYHGLQAILEKKSKK